MTQNEPKTSDLADFLRGTSSEETQKLCEQFLSAADTKTNDTFANLAETVGDDSLLAALKFEHASELELPQIQELTERIEAIVPRHAITAEELTRLLEPSELPDSLGRIGRLEVTEFLASGGMGLVFRAADPELDRDVCVKLLNPCHEFHPEAKSRFDRESREMAKMNCERIVTVLEVGRQKDMPYFVMPLLPGSSLRTLLDRSSSLQPEQATTIVRQLAEGLDYAHSQGLLHRDIKPDNLWILPGGDLKILDFGLAHIDSDAAPITHSGTVIGTPSYMSPEQVNGKPLDQRSDLFSVGVVLVEMLTGKSPFQKANLFSTLMSVASETLPIEELDPTAKIPASLQPVVLGLLEKTPDARTASAADLIKQLDAVESGNAIPKKRTSKSSSGNNALNWFVAVAAGFAACLAALAMWNMTDKGTLVVTTDDPNVEVRIAKEQVTVIDPLTQKRHVIKIGDTPLPSGVYQLETTDSESGLSFSSQTIAIKRGQQSVVTVELIAKSEPHAGEIAEATTSKRENDNAADTVWADPTRDPTAYTEAGQKAYASKLVELPALDLRELGFASAARAGNVGEHAIVQSKADPHLVGFKHVAVSDLNWEPNADGSRKAQKSDGWIQIRNSKLDKLQMMIPFLGDSCRMRWDSTNPNLLAVSNYVPEDLRDANAGQAFAIFVWVLGPKGAKLVRVFPVQSYDFVLDHGYRLFCGDDDAAKVVTLIDEQEWRFPKSSNESFGTPISPNGRYITAYSVPDKRTQHTIFDLKTGKLVRAIHGPQRLVWSADSTKLACYVKTSRSGISQGHINIIDVASGNTIRQLNPDYFSLSTERLSFSPDLDVFASSFSDGNVLLMDVKSGRKSKLDINNTVGTRKSLRWIDNTHLEITGSEKRWQFVREQGIAGKLVPDENYSKYKPQPTPRSSIRHLSMLKDGSLGVVVGKYPEKDDKNSSFYSLKIDDAENAAVRPIECNFTKGSFLSRVDVHSPSGKFAVQTGKHTGYNASYSDDTYSDVWVQNVKLENKLVKVATFKSVYKIVWSLDEKYLVVEGRYRNAQRGARTQRGARIINLQTMNQLQGRHIWNESASGFVPFKSGFLFTAGYATRGNLESKLIFLDPAEAEKELVDIGKLNKLGKFRSALFRESIDGRLIATITPHGEGKPRRAFEIDDQLKLTELDNEPEFMAVYGLPKPLLTDKTTSLIRQLNITSYIRHPDQTQAICLAGKNGTMFFDIEKQEQFGPLIRKDLGFPRPPVPCDEGWILWDDNTIFVIDFEGKLLRRRFLYVDAATGEPTVTNWVQRNGEGLEALREKHNDQNRFPMIRFKNGEFRIE